MTADPDAAAPVDRTLAAELIREHARARHGAAAAGQAYGVDQLAPASQTAASPAPQTVPPSAPLTAAHDPRARLIARGSTPTCGDEVTVSLLLDGRGRIADLVWDGRGCEVSQASASMLAQSVRAAPGGLTVVRFGTLRESLRASVRDEIVPGDVEADLLGDALALHGIGRFPLRGTCALLAWQTVADALAQAPAGASES